MDERIVEIRHSTSEYTPSGQEDRGGVTTLAFDDHDPIFDVKNVSIMFRSHDSSLPEDQYDSQQGRRYRDEASLEDEVAAIVRNKLAAQDLAVSKLTQEKRELLEARIEAQKTANKAVALPGKKAEFVTQPTRRELEVDKLLEATTVNIIYGWQHIHTGTWQHKMDAYSGKRPNAGHKDEVFIRSFSIEELEAANKSIKPIPCRPYDNVNRVKFFDWKTVSI